MTLDEALGQPGRLVAAWDYRWPDRAVLGVYATSDKGAKLVHAEEAPLEQREAMSDRVRDRGIRLGGAYTYTGHVWVVDDRGIGLWNAKASLVEGSAMVIPLRGGAVKASDVAKVITFVDPNDMTHRGVRCQMANGNVATVVDEHHEAAKADPFYTNDSLLEDMRWAILLGQDIAMWLGVPHIDHESDQTNTRQLVVAEVSRKLAAVIAKLPADGEFEHVIEPVATFAPYGLLQYRYAPNPMDLTKRFLELRLFTPSGKGSWARWVKQGTNDQVVGFLARPRTGYVMVQNMEEMSRKLAQENYE